MWKMVNTHIYFPIIPLGKAWIHSTVQQWIYSKASGALCKKESILTRWDLSMKMSSNNNLKDLDCRPKAVTCPDRSLIEITKKIAPVRDKQLILSKIIMSDEVDSKGTYQRRLIRIKLGFIQDPEVAKDILQIRVDWKRKIAYHTTEESLYKISITKVVLDLKYIDTEIVCNWVGN